MLILCRPHYTRWHTTDKNRFSVTFPIFTDHFKIFDISRYSRWVATLRRMARLSWPQQLAVTRWFINAVQRSMQVDFQLTIKYYDDDKLLLSTIDNTIKTRLFYSSAVWAASAEGTKSQQVEMITDQQWTLQYFLPGLLNLQKPTINAPWFIRDYCTMPCTSFTLTCIAYIEK